MWLFYLLILVIFSGFAVVLKLIWDEQRKESGGNLPKKKEAAVTPMEVLQRSGLKSTANKSSSVAASSSSMLKKLQALLLPVLSKKKSSLSDQEGAVSPVEIGKAVLTSGAPQTGTASIRLDPNSGKPSIRIQQPAETPAVRIEQPIKKDDTAIDKEVELSIRNDELKNQFAQLQERYDKLDKLFVEKSESLEKTLRDLEHEQKNRKEFNKVKDLLEKEIKDSKDLTRKAEAGFNSIKSESTSYAARITQLEEKIKKFASELYAKEDLLEEQSKKIAQLLSAAKAVSPSHTAAAAKTEEGGRKPAPIIEGASSPEQQQAFKEPVSPTPNTPDTADIPAESQQTKIEEPAEVKEQQQPASAADTENPPLKTPVLSPQLIAQETTQDTAASEPPVVLQQPSTDFAAENPQQPEERPSDETSEIESPSPKEGQPTAEHIDSITEFSNKTFSEKKGRTEPLEIPASQEYLSLLGTTSSREDNAASYDEEFSIDETVYAIPTLERDASETAPVDQSDAAPEDSSSEAESTLSVEETPPEEPSASRSFDDLLLKPFATPDDKTTTEEETLPKDTMTVGEDAQPFTDAPASPELIEEQQDLPEPPSMLPKKKPLSEHAGLKEEKFDDLPPLTETTEEAQESITDNNDTQDAANDNAEPTKEKPTEKKSQSKLSHEDEKESPEEEASTFNDEEEDMPSEDPDRPHLNPDIFKDINATSELEDDAAPKNENDHKKKTNL